ncbi:hypothetical protein L484_003667 [Morus notabilis]|uniref:Epidermal patterning factor-like protein n=1 Tax=Morus notabilis TaxID=981085 RepID=W9SGM8_9ROSA|nr:hypothetical protein L484_003667 [Morus notabilis]
MDQEATSRRFIFALLMITTVVHSCAAHPGLLPSSPSPSPANVMPIAEVPKPSKGVIMKKAERGSSPVTCNSKCNECEPCRPVEVSIRTVDNLQESEYYPQVWKCMCDNNIFSP